MRIIRAIALACLCAPVLTATSRAAQPAVPEWAAEYVGMDVPKTVRANRVFTAEITMKNTGSQTWGFVSGVSDPVELRSLAPAENTQWGTNYIIQGQGTYVEPGQTFTFKSGLRAPNLPGKYWFQWRLRGPGGKFGEATARLQITVGEPVPVKDMLAPIAAADRTGKRPLTFGDFTYMGSFRLPYFVGDAWAAYSESGMALREYEDGTQRLLVNYTHPVGALFEVDVPDLQKLKKFDGANGLELQTQEAKKVWGALAQNDAGANGGLSWDEDKKTLYWTYYHGYWAGGDLNVLNATKLNDDGTLTPVGSWTADKQKWHWGGLTRLPQSFADRYTGGKTLALGFGGGFSVSAPCSRGPVLSAIADPDPAASSVGEITYMLGHPEASPAVRPGNYFNANCGYWNTQPRGRGVAGNWTYMDLCRNGVMIDVPDKQGFIAFVKLGTGRLGYDYGTCTDAGQSQCWYFYDTRHLGQAARGGREIDAVLPYQIRAEKAMGGMVYGSYFDPERRKLYVLRTGAYRDGYGYFPLVHVYHLKKG